MRRIMSGEGVDSIFRLAYYSSNTATIYDKGLLLVI
jgi:hypothetical protein